MEIVSILVTTKKDLRLEFNKLFNKIMEWILRIIFENEYFKVSIINL